uniref:Uncharacterized protein n=1 Tax=Musa acuminata subsp. malaccensis TaxID=214687 RepID=A0A804JN33_MUSAM
MRFNYAGMSLFTRGEPLMRVVQYAAQRLQLLHQE